MNARAVRRLPKDPGVSGWSAILPEPPPAQPLTDEITADWLVIGGGFAGLAAARRLAHLRGGERIVLLEAGKIGEGPAGRNSGFMIDLPHKLTSEDYAGAAEQDRVQTAMNRAAIDFAADAAQEYGLSAEAFARPGKVNGAATQRGLDANRSYAAHLEGLGEPHELLDARAMRALTGSDYYLGGLFTPGAALIHPAMFVRGLAAGLAPKVAIHEMSPVTEVARVGADWRARTPIGAVTAPRIVLAVNGHAESFGYFRRRLVHVHLYASMTRALREDEIEALGGERRWGVTPSDPMGSTVRRISGTGGDRIVMRNRVTYDPDRESPESRLSRIGRTHDETLTARFPQLEGIAMDYRWGGRLCLSLNDVPAFGELEEGVFSACCQNGLGVTKGTISGVLAAELATGKGDRANAPLLAQMLAFPPPRALPPEPIAWLGAVATLKWKEWRAGRER